MAGSRHHYNPRWLQAGFADKSTEPKACTWLYRKDWEAPKLVSTKDVGLEEHFYAYGKGEERRSADEPMTSAECDVFSPLTNRLREAPAGPVKETPRELGELLSHLELRSKAFRNYVVSASAPLTEALLTLVQNPASFRPVLSQMVSAQPELFQSILAQAGIALSVADLQNMMANADNTPYSPKDLVAVANFEALPWREIFAEAMKAAHVEALLEAAVSESRKQYYDTVSFSILEAPDACFVQGDSPLTLQLQNGLFTPLNINNDPIEFAFLPLSPKRVLTAHRPGALPPPWEELRAANLACSQDYFIAAHESVELQKLVGLLGTRAPSISRDVTTTWLQEALEEPFMLENLLADSPSDSVALGIFQGQLAQAHQRKSLR